MDLATMIGLGAGLAVVGLAIASGSDMGIFLNLPGLLIVIGGAMAATLIKFPISSVFRAFVLAVKAAFINKGEDAQELVGTFKEMSQMIRGKGMLALEGVDIPNYFFRRGVRLCVDGYAPELVRQILTTEMDASIRHHEAGEKIFRALGDSAPAFGMIGTLVGLVQMLANMSDPQSIGPAMAVALLTTLYGAVIANLICLPIADKLEARREEESDTKALIIEGVLGLQRGENPYVLGDILDSYLERDEAAAPGEDEEDPAMGDSGQATGQGAGD